MPDPGNRWTLLLIGWTVCGVLYAAGPSMAAALPVEHRLEVELLPGARKLIGRDRVRIEGVERGELSFHLSARAENLRVRVNTSPRAFRFSHGLLSISLEPSDRSKPLECEILYETVFADPVPVDPMNTDDPGFGVTASIGEQGTFLLPGAGWYPELEKSRARYHLLVKGPAGVVAVTAGRSLGHETVDGHTISEWLVEHPVEGLSLSAARYEIHAETRGKTTIMLYLLPESRDLAPAYLEAAGEYVRFYSNLFGPYPFPKFAVVENFFPTGYGFPSYTLLGSTVLRLPFVLTTSLGHEIAHSWWGNGVWVAGGNWSEGLTTYVSDYLYKERRSPEEGKEYRLQATRSYTTLVPADRDFPLSRFEGRTDPVTKAVGYDKGAMVFHMLRRTIGEEPFWGALRDLFRERLFQPTSWKDLEEAFSKRAGRPLRTFFRQWVEQRGGPVLRLEDVRARPDEGRVRVTGTLSQEAPVFEVGVGAALECAGSRAAKEITLAGQATRFEMVCADSPTRLTIDPDHHLLRRLDPDEIPPSVNSLKGSDAALLVVASGASTRMARTLAVSLGLGKFEILSEKDLPARWIDGEKDVLVVGYPEDRGLLPELPAGDRLERGAFALKGLTYEDPSHTFFGVLPHPSGTGRVLAIFLPLSHKHAEAVARKITHYGRYGYLVFHEDRNTGKGTWEVKNSPVVHEWKRR